MLERAPEGTQAMSELSDEAEELVARLRDAPLDPKSSEFVLGLAQRLEQYGEKTSVSRKQIFWLRDLAERHGR